MRLLRQTNSNMKRPEYERTFSCRRLQNTDWICQRQNVANRSNLRYVANIEHNDETLYTVNWMPKEIPRMMGQQKETEEETACLALHRLHVWSAVLPAAPPLPPCHRFNNLDAYPFRCFVSSNLWFCLSISFDPLAVSRLPSQGLFLSPLPLLFPDTCGSGITASEYMPSGHRPLTRCLDIALQGEAPPSNVAYQMLPSHNIYPLWQWKLVKCAQQPPTTTRTTTASATTATPTFQDALGSVH